MINDASLVMIPSGYKDGKLYSVKPTDGSGDFTFSRGSNLAATRVNSEGLIEKGRENRLLQSNQFDTTWSKAGNLTSGQAGYDGTNNAWKIESSSIGQETRVRQSQTFTTGEVITLSVYMKKGNVNFGIVRTYAIIGGGRAWFDLENGTVATENSGINGSIEDVGNGWYRCSIWGVINTTGSVDIAPAPDDNDYLSDAVGEFIYIQDAQLEAGLVATDYIETTTTTAQAGILEDMPRLNYGTCPSLLLEPQRTNLMIQSEYISGFDSNTTTTFNYGKSPEGVNNSIKVEVNSNGYAQKAQVISGLTANTTYTFSFWLSSESTTADMRIYDNSNAANIINSTALTIPDSGWERVTQTFTTPTGCTSINVYCLANGGKTAGDLTITWGWQLEQGSYPTSYIPTYGASVTRGADDCSKTGISDLIGQTEGTMFLDFKLDKVNVSNNHTWIAIKDSSQTNRILLYMLSNESILRSQIKHSGTAINFNLGTITDGQNIKVAIAYKSGDSAIYLNGSSIATNTNSLTFGTMDRFDFNDSSLSVEGDINQAILFPTRLSNDELAALTT